MGRVDTITVKPKSVIVILPFENILNLIHRRTKTHQQVCRRGWANSAKPFGHHSSTDSHRWQGRKSTGGQSCKDTSFISYNKVFNRLSDLQRSKSFDRIKEHLCCIESCNNFLSAIPVRVGEDIYFSDDSMPKIFCMKHFYIFPLAWVCRGWMLLISFYSSFTVNSQRSNTKAVEFPKLCVVLMHGGV